MKMLALVVALLSVPAFAADYSPWSGQAGERFAQATKIRECSAGGLQPNCPGCAASCPPGHAAVCKNAVTENNNGKLTCVQPAQCSCE
jgi:hypothetical protein